jgi:hypothetical protein
MDSIVVFNAETVLHTKDLKNTHTEKVVMSYHHYQMPQTIHGYPANEPIKLSTTSAEYSFTQESHFK